MMQGAWREGEQNRRLPKVALSSYSDAFRKTEKRVRKRIQMKLLLLGEGDNKLI